MTTSLSKFLDDASAAYYNGNPLISDEQFDYLADMIGYNRVGSVPKSKKGKHLFPMYSLLKYYPGEGKVPLLEYVKHKVKTPKLDGAAISLQYVGGQLVQGLTRGDGVEGELITDKLLISSLVPHNIEDTAHVQITGEVVAPKTIANARNYAAGALGLNDAQEFLNRELYFVAYDVDGSSTKFDYYTQRLEYLKALGFNTVLDTEFCDNFRHDGVVTRVNSNDDFVKLGYTSKHPRGAFATKQRNAGVPSILKEVVWQTGKSGKVTPVAIFEPVVIDDANISRATLNNPGYIRALDLDIGDTVYIARSGDIIPQVVRSEKRT